MTVSNGAQALEFLYSLSLGLGIGAFYVLTHLIKRLRLLGDIVFVLAALSAASVFFMTVCGGLVRLFHLCGILTGMLCAVRFGTWALTGRKNGQKQKKSEKT